MWTALEIARLLLFKPFFSLLALYLELREQSLLVFNLSLPELKLFILLVKAQQLLSLDFELLNDGLLLTYHTLQLLVLTLQNFLTFFHLDQFVAELGTFMQGIRPFQEEPFHLSEASIELVLDE